MALLACHGSADAPVKDRILYAVPPCYQQTLNKNFSIQKLQADVNYWLTTTILGALIEQRNIKTTFVRHAEASGASEDSIQAAALLDEQNLRKMTSIVLKNKEEYAKVGALHTNQMQIFLDLLQNVCLFIFQNLALSRTNVG